MDIIAGSQGRTAEELGRNPQGPGLLGDLGRALPAAALGLVVLASQLPTAVAPPVELMLLNTPDIAGGAKSSTKLYVEDQAPKTPNRPFVAATRQ